MAPFPVAGGLTQSSSSSGIFFQGDGQSQSVVNSHFPGMGRSNLGPVSRDIDNAVLNSVANSGPSVGESSLVTDANSGLSGGPHLHRSTSINNESYMRLPASPMSFSSNNISISGSSVMDGSSIVQQSCHQGQNAQQSQQQLRQHGASSATSLPMFQGGQGSISMGPRVPGSFAQESNGLSHAQKKPRLDIKQEDIFQQQMLQQMQRCSNPQLPTLMQQQMLRQQQNQQILQSMPQLQRAQLQQQHQMQLRQQLQGMQQTAAMKRPYDSGVCARRLMQYLYHQRQRPADNTIAYWRKFVAEYYSPRAKKRWCLSLYDNVGQHALGVFPQAAMDAWQCDICGSKSGRGFEATFEVLPRLNEIKFSSGVIDELLFLDLPRECRFPSGLMMLEYGKAVQESVYEQLRVIREGQLRIIFTQDLKVLSWEFCARRHEELLPRRLVAPQVNQLVQAAQKCQSTIAECGSDGVSQQDLQTNSNMVLSAGRQLAKTLELQSVNDLGFSKRYVRCLQISEVVSSMKDLIDFCREQKVGPIDGLKNYPRLTSTTKIQMQNMQQMNTDQNTLNKSMPLHPGLNQQMTSRGAMSSPAQAALALTNYQNLFMRQNSMNNPNPNSLQQEASSSFNNSNQASPSAFQIPHQMQNRSFSANSSLQQNHPQLSQGNQALHQQMIHQLLHEMSSSSGGAVQNMNGSVGSSTSVARTDIPSGNARPAPSRSNSFKDPSTSSSSAPAPGAGNGFGQRAPDMAQNLHFSEDLVLDIAHEFSEGGFFNNDLDDSLGFD